MPQHITLEEQRVLENLVSIRHRLSRLKKDQKSYYREEDIVTLYDELCQQVARLREVREIEHHESDQYKNRVDDVLDDIYQLFSLFYLALGKNREVPATYVQLVTIKQNLELLNEIDVFKLDDLIPYKKRLESLEKIINNSEVEEGGFQQAQLSYISKRLRQCKRKLDELYRSVEEISPELIPIRRQLIEIRKKLVILSTQKHFDAAQIRDIQSQLRELDNQRDDGKFLAADGTIPAGQAQVVGLLEQCFDEVHELLASSDSIAESLKPIADRLIDIKQSLEKLVLTHRWTMRETDLWSYQVQLDEIDKMRKDGKFYDADGNVPAGQMVIHFLLHRCYHLIYVLLSSSEPVAEPLVPIHNQLRTLRQCLLAVKKYGGPFSPRDLYPYQMKLSSIDNLRIHGKFLDDEGNTPEGQGVIHSLLNECYDIIYELMASSDQDKK
ncbi:hypothetical protein H4R33_004623 [Dimargaris cristalligena]|uniref:Uncharacterized protein n=1 Tax=Dimargaris cristalligena TaxID=215637 RepID=A0A4P9ZXF4_9FUNG|nr:hypothetical protein H4R33_004623 [Dimargaris cristalligena]RKP37711.1 hypothetical protein BJ085DRAFT_35625 [Dimargaris cristalligena]|eukprot:RKP37711.1 hypothetical protein BJ085DRAFT_35625 [Dimargaris cristalligena]